jgi:hypothetical protein
MRRREGRPNPRNDFIAVSCADLLCSLNYKPTLKMKTQDPHELIAEAIRIGTQNLKEWQEYGRKWKARYDEMIETCRITGQQRDDATRWRWIDDAPKDGTEVLLFSARSVDVREMPSQWIAQVGKYDAHDQCWVESHEGTKIYPLHWMPIYWHNTQHTGGIPSGAATVGK